MRLPLSAIVSLCIAASLSANIVSAQPPPDNPWSDSFNRMWDWFQNSESTDIPTDLQNFLKTAARNLPTESIHIPNSLIVPTASSQDNNSTRPSLSIEDSTVPSNSSQNGNTTRTSFSNDDPPPSDQRVNDDPDQDRGPSFSDDDEPPFDEEVFDQAENEGFDQDIGPPQQRRPGAWSPARNPSSIEASDVHKQEMSVEEAEDPAELWELRQKQIKEIHENAEHISDIRKDHPKVEPIAEIKEPSPTNNAARVKLYNALVANALDDAAANPSASPAAATVVGMQPGVLYAIIAAAAVCVVVLVVGAASYGVMVSRKRNEARKEHMRMIKEVSAVGPDLRTSISAPREEVSRLLDQRPSMDVEAQRPSGDYSRISLDSTKGGKKRILLS